LCRPPRLFAPLSPFLFLSRFAQGYGFPRDVARTLCNADTRAHPLIRTKAEELSSPSGSHVFPTASRSYNGAVASRRPERTTRGGARGSGAAQRFCRSGVRRPVPARQSPLVACLPSVRYSPGSSSWNVGHDLEVKEVEKCRLYSFLAITFRFAFFYPIFNFFFLRERFNRII